jgi:hypothetical protein
MGAAEDKLIIRKENGSGVDCQTKRMLFAAALLATRLQYMHDIDERYINRLTIT